LPRPRNADTAKLPRFQELKHQVRDIIFNRVKA
jgi:NitT/TauT family transport system ATP-binding protein